METSELLSIQKLHVSFKAENGRLIPVVRGINLRIQRGRVVGLVGESGSGKTVTSLATMGLLDESSHVRGEIRLDDTDLLSLSRREWEDIRGEKMSMIFQDPIGSLNPVYRVGKQVAEALNNPTDSPHGIGRAAVRGSSLSRKTRQEKRRRTLDLLQRVGITHPEARYYEYPHELSGGMSQRAAIAMALAGNPELLIADEPTTALDVTIQAQILELLLSLRDEFNLSILLITHDLGVVAEYCDFVYVMYAGHIVEQGPAEAIFSAPAHPYTRGLLASIPSVHSAGKPLRPITGHVPKTEDLPEGCPFFTRCNQRLETCELKPAPDVPITQTHSAACHRLTGEKGTP